MKLLKQLYSAVALVALVNLLGVGGLVGYLVSSGQLDEDKARAVVALIKGEKIEQESEDASEVSVEEDDSEIPIEARVATSREQARVSQEIARRDTDRYRTQLEQRLKFIQRERLELDRMREEFKRQQEQAHASATRSRERQQTAGFAKELEILRSLKPDAALTQIMTMEDAQAAELLFKLETRKVKKIFEAAKTEAQTTKLTAIRELIRDVKSADALARGGRR